MAVILAFCSAISSSVSTVITKKGVKNVDSNLATFIRIGITFLFTMAVIVFRKSYESIAEIPLECLLPLILSGVCSGLSWLFYFKSLSLGDVSKLTPVDNFSTVLSMLLAILFLHEPITWSKSIAMALITLGTLLMVGSPASPTDGHGKAIAWLPFALLALVTGSCSSIMVKLALTQMDSTLVTGIRNFISLLIAAVSVVFQKGRSRGTVPNKITASNWKYLISSGLLIGFASLCNYQALQMAEASIIVPIDKSSLVFTVLLSCLFLKERPDRRNWTGLIFIALGTVPLVL